MIDKDWLYQKYYTEQLSSRQIAKIIGRTYVKVLWWMEKYDFVRRNKSEAIIGDKNPMSYLQTQF